MTQSQFYSLIKPCHRIGLLFTFIIFGHSASGQVETEPNNSLITADTIKMNSTMTGTVKTSDDINDYFKTLLPADGTLKVYIQGTNNGASDANLGIYCYDGRKEDGEILRHNLGNSIIATGTTVYDTITLYGRAADTFYFRLEAYGTFSYKLKYNIIDTSKNDLEPNENFDNSIFINNGENKKGHISYIYYNYSGVGNNGPSLKDDYDYYKTLLKNDGILKIYVQGINKSGEDGSLTIRGYDKRKEGGIEFSENIGHTSNDSTFADTITVSCLAADSFYFRVESNGAFSYQLSYDLKEAGSNDEEPNNTFETAKSVILNDTTSGHLGYRIGSENDDRDIYKTILQGKGSIRIYIEATNISDGTGGLYFRGYDRNKDLISGRYISDYAYIHSGETVYDTITLNCINTDTFYSFLNSNVCFKYLFRQEYINLAPVANFDYTRTGNLFEFSTIPLNSTTYKWDFGDGTTSSLVNPPLKSFKSGFYNVKLITNNTNGCSYRDTIIKGITVKGIERYTPISSGNGNLLFTIYGGGLTDGNVLKLTQGSKVYVDSNAQASNYGNIYTCLMNMHNAPLGLYDVDIITDDSTYHFANGFNLQTYYDNLRVELVGRDIVRATDEYVYKIRVHNEGNTLAGTTEVFILLPENISFKFLDSLVAPEGLNYPGSDTFPEYVSVKTDNGYPINGKLRGYIISRIPQGGYKDLTVLLKAELGEIPMFVYVKGPYNGSEYRLWSENCLKSTLKFGLSTINFALDLTPGVDCLFSFFKAVYSTEIPFLTGEFESSSASEQHSISFSIGKSWYTAILIQCAGEFSIITPLAPLAPMIEAASLSYDIVVGSITLNKNYRDMANACGPASKDESIKRISGRNSIDPNAKSGRPGFGQHQYINGTKKLTDFTIFFENIKTATLPAQKVIVLDTIDSNVFNLKTFKVGGFGIGTKSYNVTMDNKEFITDVVIDSTISVRFNIKLDTLTGILKATFKTIDRLTNMSPTDPLVGFLPPNSTSPEGEGYLTYSIELKDGLTDGTIVNNKASIIFDNNTPIVTNTWHNTLDNISPTSFISSVTPINDSAVKIVINGFDTSSGVKLYQFYSSTNGSEFKLIGKVLDTVTFQGQIDSTYSFYVLAVDSVGNIENKVPLAEATITFKTLPIRMLPLAGEIIGKINRLEWTTLTEQNNKGFYIERSENGRQFSSIGFVASKTTGGNSNSRLSYDYTDDNLLQQAYYRLRQLDLDSHTSYSNIILLNRALNISIYPNPASNEVVVNSNQKVTSVQITDISGRLVQRYLPSINNHYSITGLKGGIYVLQVFTKESNRKIKFIIK